jgi:prepilin-type N-terminal cleavage/methylation domain-containing protein
MAMTTHLQSKNSMRARGFTLVEMAMVLSIVALLLAGLLPMISSQVEQRRLNDTQRQINEIRDALIGYAVINGRLPCPASSTSTDGTESFASGHDASDGICSNFYDGYIPAATLGLPGMNQNGLVVDSWGNPIRYAITLWNNSLTKTGGMSDVGISGLNPGSVSYLLVCSTATGINTSTPSCGSTGKTLTPSPGVPLVLFSTGSNGVNSSGGDETQNLSNTRIFISHDQVQNGYDDIITWVSANTLINRMVAAGKLP